MVGRDRQSMADCALETKGSAEAVFHAVHAEIQLGHGQILCFHQAVIHIAHTHDTGQFQMHTGGLIQFFKRSHLLPGVDHSGHSLLGE